MMWLDPENYLEKGKKERSQLLLFRLSQRLIKKEKSDIIKVYVCSNPSFFI